MANRLHIAATWFEVYAEATREAAEALRTSVLTGLSGILCIGCDLRVRGLVLWTGKDHVYD